MAEKFLKVEVVGCGFIAQNAHILSILKCRDVRLAVTCDKNEDLARSVGPAFGWWIYSGQRRIYMPTSIIRW